MYVYTYVCIYIYTYSQYVYIGSYRQLIRALKKMCLLEQCTYQHYYNQSNVTVGRGLQSTMVNAGMKK